MALLASNPAGAGSADASNHCRLNKNMGLAETGCPRKRRRGGGATPAPSAAPAERSVNANIIDHWYMGRNPG